ncbi:MAG: amino acid ABC transporter ATP-binding/permease protein [Anaerorhabdus sp.]
MNRRRGLNIVFSLIVLVKSMVLLMVLAVVFGVLGFLASIAISVLGVTGIIQVLKNNNEYLKILFMIILFCSVIRGILRYIEQALNHYIAFKILAIVRDKVFKKLRELTPAKLETKDKGDIITIITNDTEMLEVFYAHTISPVFIALVVSLIMTLIFMNYHFILGFIGALAYITVGIILPMYTSFKGKDIGYKQQSKFAQLNAFVLECINGSKEVIQYQLNNKINDELINKSNEYNEYNQKIKNIEASSRSLLNLVIMSFVFLIFVVSLYLFNSGLINQTDVIIVTVIMASSFGPVIALSNLANNLLITFASGDRILNLLEEVPQVIENQEGIDEDYLSTKINNVSFSYDNEEVLKDISLSFNKHGIFGIKGKSGSGKSTLLKLLMRFYDPKCGSVCLNDQDLKIWSTNGIRKTESWVGQNVYLLNDTILNNIKIANDNASEEEVIKACKKANIHDFIMSLEKGYNSKISETKDNLSAGQKQRIGLARAFLKEYDLLLLDEPTSNLDSLNEAIIMKSIKENVKDKTVILVSHRESSLKICDEVINLKGIKSS